MRRVLINLDPEAEAKLRAEAGRLGCSLSEVVRRLLVAERPVGVRGMRVKRPPLSPPADGIGFDANGRPWSSYPEVRARLGLDADPFPVGERDPKPEKASDYDPEFWAKWERNNPGKKGPT